jgi:hypothetical protein
MNARCNGERVTIETEKEKQNLHTTVLVAVVDGFGSRWWAE